MIEVELNMTVEEADEVTMSVDDIDEVEFGASDVIVIRDHNILVNRDLADQHPISAITGLQAELDNIPTKTSELQNDSGFVTSSSIPTKTSQLTNDSGFITSVPVTSVNNKTGAVVLSASDVNALPSDTTIPSKTSQLTNDSGYITGIDGTDVTSALGYTPYNASNPDGFVTTDNKTEQAYISNPSSYSYWRPLMIGANASSAEGGAFATTTDKVYGADAIRVQPSSGTIKATTFKGDLDGTANGILYGEVDDTSTSTAFTAQIDGVTSYYQGLTILLKNGVVTSAASCTININGLGAKPIYHNMAAATAVSTVFNINYTLMFIYDEDRVSGGCWLVYYGYYTSSNSIGYQIRTNSMSLPMDSVTYRYRLLFRSVDGKEFVPANNSSSTNATGNRTVNQTPFDPFGDIIYYGTTASVSAGSRPSAAYLWTQYVITLGYSFAKGSALTMTLWKPVYLVAAPQANGSAILDSTTPWVQDLPTTDDGKIYIYLGVAVTATTVEMVVNHPIYWYKDGAVRHYTGEPYIPKAPTQDGTYTLTASVSDGEITYSWV